MFSSLDYELFSNDCQVLEIVPDSQYVYPIFKNGSSSLHSCINYRCINKQELNSLKEIDVYVRDPHQRFLSGVQTFIQNLGSQADKKTALYFIEKYLYLNLHYCPQVYWLINLSRFTDAKFRIKDISELSKITSYYENKSQPDLEISEYFSNKTKVRFFNEIDEVLTVNLINQTVSLQEILSIIKKNYGSLFDETFNLTQQIADVLSKT